VATLSLGSAFGEPAFVDTCSKRTATVISNEETSLFIVEQSSKQFVIGIRSSIAYDRQKKYAFLKSIEHQNAIWRTTYGTTSVSAHKQFDRELRESAKFAFSKSLASGNVVVAQGSKCNSIFFVVRGSVDVIVTLQGMQTSSVSKVTLPTQLQAQAITAVSVKDGSEQDIRYYKRATSPISYVHNGNFHSNLVIQCVNGPLITTHSSIDAENLKLQVSSHRSPVFVNSDTRLSGIPNKITQSKASFSFQNQQPISPKPPIEQHQVHCSPRTRRFVQEPKLKRKFQKVFRLKTVMGGNVIGS